MIIGWFVWGGGEEVGPFCFGFDRLYKAKEGRGANSHQPYFRFGTILPSSTRDESVTPFKR